MNLNLWNIPRFSSSTKQWTWPKPLGIATGLPPPFLLPLPLHPEEELPLRAVLIAASPPPPSPPSLLCNHEKNDGEEDARKGLPMTRRLAIGSALAMVVPLSASLSLADSGMVMADEEEAPAVSLNLEPYVDQTEGFQLLRPSQWTQVEKSGATVLFEDPSSKGNNVGVVVNPVRITSLKDFGDLDTVAEKLLQAEEKKPSTKSARLLVTREREAHGGAPLYELEYQLDSTRGGVKRVLSAVTVASRKLYVLNLAYVDSPEKPLPSATISILEQILNSFELLN